MTSKEAIERMFDDLRQFEEHFIGCICFDTKEEFNIIKKDLDRLEKLEKENKELKEKVNRFEKIIEDIKNLPELEELKNDK